MLKLPDIHEANCEALSLCAAIETDSKSLITWLKTNASDGPIVANSRRPGGSIYIIAWTGGVDDKHFHLELNTREVVAKQCAGKPPKAPNKVHDIYNLHKRLSGNAASVMVRSRFHLESRLFPDIIRSCLIEAESGEVKLRVTGGRIDVTGAPVDKIIWSLLSDGSASVSVEAKRTTAINDNYCTDSFRIVHDAYRAIVLGKIDG